MFAVALQLQLDDTRSETDAEKKGTMEKKR